MNARPQPPLRLREVFRLLERGSTEPTCTELDDRLTLRELQDALDAGDEISTHDRAEYSAALGRLLRDDYAVRPTGRASENRRNVWLSVHVALLRDHRGTGGPAAALEVSRHCSAEGLAIAATTLEKLPSRHNGAHIAAVLVDVLRPHNADPVEGAIKLAWAAWRQYCRARVPESRGFRNA